MRTMHGALSSVARSFGMAAVAPDAAGFAELVVEETLSVFLRTADEFEIELSARIPEFDGAVTVEVAEELLRWNGRFTGMRFALEPDRNGVVLGRRIDIRVGDEGAVAQAVSAFILAVADWRHSGAAELMRDAMRPVPADVAAGMAGLRL